MSRITAPRSPAIVCATTAILCAAVIPGGQADARPNPTDFGSLGTGSLDRPPGNDYLDEHFDVDFVFESQVSTATQYRVEITAARSHCVDAMSPTDLKFNKNVPAGSAEFTNHEVFSYDPTPSFDSLIPTYCFWENNYGVWAVHVWVNGDNRQDWQVEFLNGREIGYGTGGDKISVTRRPGLAVTVRLKR